MSDWIAETLESGRDKHRRVFLEWVEGLVKAGYNEQETAAMFLEEWAGKKFFWLYSLWLKEYFDDMKEPV